MSGRHRERRFRPQVENHLTLTLRLLHVLQPVRDLGRERAVTPTLFDDPAGDAELSGMMSVRFMPTSRVQISILQYKYILYYGEVDGRYGPEGDGYQP